MPLTHIRSLRTRLTQFIDTLRSRVRNSRDFGGLDVAETERLLRDVGLSMGDMPALTKPLAGPTVLLPQRLDLVGIDMRYLEQVDPVTLKDLQRSCLRCASWRSCARDLARGDVQSGLDSYCLNAPLIDQLVLARHGRDAMPTGT
jgi:hypothetical protein